MNNKTSIALLIVAVVCLLLLSIGAGFLIGSKQTKNVPIEMMTLQPSIEPTPQTPTATVEPVRDSITIPGFERITLKARESTQSVNLYNPAHNTCYFEVSLCLPEGTEIFHSGLIAPGQTVQEIELSHTLEAGNYEGAILKYDCSALDDLSPLNGAVIEIALEVTK